MEGPPGVSGFLARLLIRVAIFIALALKLLELVFRPEQGSFLATRAGPEDGDCGADKGAQCGAAFQGNYPDNGGLNIEYTD